ncbi:methyltransferase domain-containing protein [Candidatus Roizmanbacteria bacterium]|nr:methyltransferase domain-containing protein [Candidatus Roizmanbacteria bacterium]
MIRTEEHQYHLDKVIAYYNTAQKYYDAVWGTGLHYGLWTEGVQTRAEAIEQENEILADIARVKPGDLVLDAGSGVSNSGIWLAKNRGAHVLEFNITASQLSKGKEQAIDKRVAPFLDFVQGDYQYLPFKSNSIDVFWALESIEHADNVPLLVREAYRIVRRGGRAVIAGTFKGSTKPTERQTEQLNTGMRAAGAFNDFRSAQDVAEVLYESGFNFIGIHDTTDFIMPSAEQMSQLCRWGLPGARLGNKLGIISDIMVDNTAWGTYQEDLFTSGVTTYHIIAAEKT